MRKIQDATRKLRDRTGTKLKKLMERKLRASRLLKNLLYHTYLSTIDMHVFTSFCTQDSCKI